MSAMLPLHRDPAFLFRFTDDRLIPRFHLDGVAAGTPVAVHWADPTTGEPAGRIADAVAGEGGWVELARPIVVRAGQAFVAVPG
jgi:hypothetical protein